MSRPTKDSKSLLDVQEVMSKKGAQLEITLALMLLAYGLRLMMGEATRDEAYEAAEKAGKKGPRIGKDEAQMGALLRALRAAQEAAEFTARQWQAALARVLALWRQRLLPPLPNGV